jgi:hypothetical protein
VARPKLKSPTLSVAYFLLAALATRALGDLNEFDGGACRSLQNSCSADEKQTSGGPINLYNDVTRKSSCVALILCASPLRTVQQSINDLGSFNGVVPASKQPDFSPNVRTCILVSNHCMDPDDMLDLQTAFK